MMIYIVKDNHGVEVAKFRWRDHAELFVAAECAATGNEYYIFSRNEKDAANG